MTKKKQNNGFKEENDDAPNPSQQQRGICRPALIITQNPL